MTKEVQWKSSILFLGNVVLPKKNLKFPFPAFYPFIAHNFQEKVDIETNGKMCWWSNIYKNENICPQRILFSSSELAI